MARQHTGRPCSTKGRPFVVLPALPPIIRPPASLHMADHQYQSTIFQFTLFGPPPERDKKHNIACSPPGASHTYHSPPVLHTQTHNPTPPLEDMPSYLIDGGVIVAEARCRQDHGETLVSLKDRLVHLVEARWSADFLAFQLICEHEEAQQGQVYENKTHDHEMVIKASTNRYSSQTRDKHIVRSCVVGKTTGERVSRGKSKKRSNQMMRRNPQEHGMWMHQHALNERKSGISGQARYRTQPSSTSYL